jgi:predicted dehydrogenase
MLNVYGKEASAYYDLHNGLRHLRQGEDVAVPVSCDKTDVIAQELEEFARAIRGDGTPEVGGARATASLAVIRAGVLSVAERRVVDVAEILADGA